MWKVYGLLCKRIIVIPSMAANGVYVRESWEEQTGRRKW
jgi:hypothetical protein